MQESRTFEVGRGSLHPLSSMWLRIWFFPRYISGGWNGSDLYENPYEILSLLGHHGPFIPRLIACAGASGTLLPSGDTGCLAGVRDAECGSFTRRVVGAFRRSSATFSRRKTLIVKDCGRTTLPPVVVGQQLPAGETIGKSERCIFKAHRYINVKS